MLIPLQVIGCCKSRRYVPNWVVTSVILIGLQYFWLRLRDTGQSLSCMIFYDIKTFSNPLKIDLLSFCVHIWLWVHRRTVFEFGFQNESCMSSQKPSAAKLSNGNFFRQHCYLIKLTTEE